MGPLKCRFFSIVNTTVPPDPRLVESTDVEELPIRRADYQLYVDFRPCGESEPLTSTLFKGQLYSYRKNVCKEMFQNVNYDFLRIE